VCNYKKAAIQQQTRSYLYLMLQKRVKEKKKHQVNQKLNYRYHRKHTNFIITETRDAQTIFKIKMKVKKKGWSRGNNEDSIC
jgi:hypothetical protein